MRAAATRLLAGAALVCAAAWPATAVTSKAKLEPKSTAPDTPEVTEGTLETRDGKQIVDVPLEHTEVTMRVAGHLAAVEVEQRFVNPFDRKIEAVYLFPLPTAAGVNHLEIEVNGRVTVGEVQKREQAKATYVKAKKGGHVAALLTQERPNLFTQQVANIEPGARVTVRLRYVQPLAYQDGGYELVFPMVAPPRYVPPKSKAAAAQGGDAEAVQPKVLPPGMRSSHDIGLSVELDAGVPITALRSPSHQLQLEQDPAQPARAKARIAAGDTIPNKDFILRYDVAGQAPSFALMTHRDGGQGAFFLVMQPPAADAAGEVAPREVIFLVDTSSSMRGLPLAKAKALVRGLLATLRPDDTFQIVRFADSTAALSPQMIAAKPKNLDIALAWLDGLAAEGTTEMIEGIGAALDLPHDPARLRLVVFITDGYVGNEDEVLAAVHAKIGDARLFSFGVGSAVNRYLLEEMAAFGRGDVQVVRPDEDTVAAVKRFHERVSKPVLTDVTIDWGGLAVADLTPAAIPDLFVGQPIVLAGHYHTPGAATVTVKGRAGGRQVSFSVPVELPESRPQPAIATVWARARITELTRAEIRGATAATTKEITDIALSHGLLTRYTAFVAVDAASKTGGGDAERVVVPVEVPEGIAIRGGHLGAGSGTIGYGSYGGVGVGMGGGGSYAVTKSLDIDAAYDPVPMAKAAPPASPTVQAPPPADAVAENEPKAGAEAGDETRGRFDSAGAAPGLAQQAKTNAAGLGKALEAELKQTPGARGSYELRVTIDVDGRVAKVEVLSRPDGGAGVVAALVKQVKGWRFSPVDEAVTIEFKVVL